MGAGFSSQPGHALFRVQGSQGTLATDLTTAGIAVPLRSGALGSDRTLMIPDPEIGGGRDVVDAFLGPVKWSGQYDYYGRVNSVLTFLFMALGVQSQSTTSGITTHTITPEDGATLPYYSIEEQIGAGLEVFNYTDAVCNTLHLEAAADGYIMGTIGLAAARQVAGVTPTDVANLLDTGTIPVGTNITVTYNGVTLPAKSFTLDVNNNLDETDFRLGSYYLGSIIPKRREVTAGVVIRQQDSALWRQAVYGVSSATAPGGLTTKQQMIITIQTYNTIPGGTPPTPYTITITLPKVAITPYNLAPSGDAVIEPTLALHALRPLLGTPVMTATVKTNVPTIA